MKEFSTNPFDWFNYIAQNYNSNALIQSVLKFEKPLDLDAMKSALRACAVVEPVLNCVWNEELKDSRWLSCSNDICEVLKYIETDNLDKEIDNFLSERIDVRIERPLKIAMLANKNNTAVVVKLHHAFSDAAGVIKFVNLLSEMYSQVVVNHDFIPAEGIPSRGTSSFYEYFGVENKAARFDPTQLAPMTSSWGTPVGDNLCSQSFEYKSFSIEKKELDNIIAFANKNDSNLNSVFTAAYFTALLEILQPEVESKELQFTASLGKYTNKANSICNLSNMYNVILPTRLDFIDLIKETKLAIDKILDPEKILQSVLACDMTGNIATLDGFYAADWENVKKTGLCTPMISNLGRLSENTLTFGSSKVAEMFFVPPAFIGPSFMLSIGSYGNITTFCSAYYKPSTTDEFVVSLFEKMKTLLKVK